MLFVALVALHGISIVAARRVASAFSRLTLRLTAFNANWNPWSLRRDLLHLSRECVRLHNAQRIGTRVVGCLSENEIHRHYLRMMGHAETPATSAEYIGGKLITRDEAERGLPSDAECEATRAEFKLKRKPHWVIPIFFKKK